MIAFILLLGSLCGCFIACQDESDPENTESSTEGQTTEATTSATTAARTPKKPSVSQRPSGGGADGIVTIACIGDSITEGAILDEADKPKYSYPARLAEALGEGYEVINYGKSGATMCGSAVNHYKAKNWFTFSGKYDDLKSRVNDIDIAFIMLGTNDGNTTNTVGGLDTLFANNVDAFKADYKANLTQMVNDLRGGNPNVKIYLMTNPECYRATNDYAWEKNLADVVRPYERELATELGLDLYDMYAFSAEKMGQKCFPDSLHPGKYGYYLMGQELAGIVANMYGTEVLKGEMPTTKLNYNETFDTVANGTVLAAQTADAFVNVGSMKLKVRVLESSSLTVNNGVLAITRNATTTDAFLNVCFDDNIFEGKHTFETSVKAGEDFNSRGAMFVMFGYQFVKFTVAGDLTNNAGTKIGALSTTEFMKIAVTVDCDAGTYETYINDTRVDSGSFTLVATDYFRPVQFFASGSSTIYLDYIKAFNVTE